MKNRYLRNMKSLSIEENEKLKKFKVCVIGCGGLGGHIIEMLGRLGIGYITCVDGDVFEETNLNRQILCDEISLGQQKSLKAKNRMNLVNSEVYINSIVDLLTEDNAKEILYGHDVIIDALDNIKGRFILQKVCKEINVPLIHGAIGGWFGQATTIFPGDDTLNYIYKNKTSELENKLGNPSFTPATIASIQVSEAIKVLLNKGDTLRNKVLLVDLLFNEYNIVNIGK